MSGNGHPRFRSSLFISYFATIFLSSLILDVEAAFSNILPALGRPALLGEFYDARNQSFLGVTLFRNDIPPDKLIKTMDITQSDIKYGIVDSTKSKMFHLEVNAEVKVEMMSGKLKASGSAAYFSEEKKSSMEVEGYLMYKSKTQREVLNLLYDEMKPHLKLESLDKIEATHIVIAREFGADVIVKFLSKASNEEEQTKIQGALETAFSVEKISVGAAANMSLVEQKEDKFSNFSLSVYGDINVGSSMPQSIKDVLELINKVPAKLKEINNGKGVPMVYTLFPISTLAELLNSERLQQKAVNDLDEAILTDFIKMFEKIGRVQQELNDLEAKVKQFSNCTSAQDVARVEDLNSKFSDESLQFKLEAREAMDMARVITKPPETAIEKPGPNLQPTESPTKTQNPKSRSDSDSDLTATENEDQNEDENESTKTPPIKRNVSQKETRNLMKKVLIEYQKREYSVDKVSAKLEMEFEAVHSKIELYKVFFAAGVEYFGRFGSFNNLRLRTSDRILYAIYMLESSSTEWENNWELFLNQLKRPFSHLAVVDCAFKDDTCTNIQSGENKTVMRQYYRAKMISKDVYADLSQSKTSKVERPVLIVSSIGRNQGIGDLYNSKAHQFTGKSILEPGTNLTKMNLITEDFSNETTDIMNNGFEEKFRVMGIQPPAVQYQILLNPQRFQGVGRTFTENRGFQPQWISSTLYHVYNTVSEAILDVDEGSFDFISISRLLKGGATHFVTAVVYGSQTSITLSAPLPQNITTTSLVSGTASIAGEIAPKIRNDLVKIWDILTAKSKLSPKEAETEKISKIPLSPLNYEIKFASDIFQNARQEFRTEKDLADFLNEFPLLKFKTNKGKGKPLLYLLYPVENLQQYFGVIPGIPNDPIELQNSALALEVARIFEAFNEAEEKIALMKTTLNKNKLYITDQTLDEFQGIDRNFQRAKREFVDKLRDLVKNKDDEKIKQWLLQLKTGPTGGATTFFNATGNSMRFVALDPFAPQLEKLDFLDPFRKSHPLIKYYGREKLLASDLSSFGAGEFVYILFYRTKLFVEKAESWVDNFDLMTRHLVGKPYNKLFLMDCDFEDESCKISEDSVIHLYRNNELVSENVLKDWNAAMERRTRTVERHSLGSKIQLGQLYNIHSETFLDKSILKTDQIKLKDPTRPLFVEIPAVPKIQTKVISTSDLNKRFEALELESELQLALLFGAKDRVSLGGSGEFLQENLQFSKAVLLSSRFNSMAIDLKSPNFQQYFDPNSIVKEKSDGFKEGPTHFVKEVRAGSITVVALGNSATPADVEYLEKNLGKEQVVSAFSLLEAASGGGIQKPKLEKRWWKAKMSKRSTQNTEEKRLSNLEQLEDFSIYTDILINNKQTVIHGGNLTQLILTLSEKTQVQNFEKEAPHPSFSYILEPIETLQRPLGILTPSYKYEPLPETFQVSPIVEKYHAFVKALNETENFETEMFSPANKMGMKNSSLEKIEKIHHQLRDTFTNFKISFRDELHSFKNGSREEESESSNRTEKLQELLDQVKNVLTIDGKYNRLLELEEEREKLEFLKYVEAKPNMRYFGRDRTFNDIILTDGATKYVLYYKSLPSLANNPLWMNTTDIFFKLSLQGEKCFIVDCDFPSFNCTNLERPLVSKYQDGVLLLEDYVATVVIKKNQTTAEMDHQKKWLENLQDQVESLQKSLGVENAALENVRGKLSENVERFDGKLNQLEGNVTTLEETATNLGGSLDTLKTNVVLFEESLGKSLVSIHENISRDLQDSSTSILQTVNEQLSGSLVPVGFIYIQYQNQSSPLILWSQYSWTNVTADYAGLFFRAAGGTSLAFNETGMTEQGETSPRIVTINRNNGQYGANSVSLRYDYSGFQDLNLNGFGNQPQHLSIYTNGNTAVITRNQAIRIWKRYA